MNIYSKIILFFFLFQIVLNGNTGEKIDTRRYFLKRFDNSAGLSQNTVTCILQDELGVMWFGTKDGLNKYDGHSFTVFRQEIGKPDGLKDNYITVLCEKKDSHRLWIGTSKGIFIYDMLREKFSPFDKETSDKHTKINRPIYDIKYDNRGILWIATQGQGLFSYDESNDILTHHVQNDLKADSDILSLDIDSRGFLWIAIYNTGLFYSEDNLNTLSRFTHEDIADFMVDGAVYDMKFGPNNHLYIVSDKRGLKEINVISKKVRNLLDTSFGGNNLFMRKIAFASETDLWIGTESGVYIVNLNTLQYSHFEHELGDPYSLSDNAVHSLYKDRDGSMWIGTYFGGVNYYSKQSALFEKYYPIPGKEGLSGERVREFCESSNGDIWIGTEDGGLNLFSPKTKKITPFLKSKLYHNIHALCYDANNNLWVGTFSEGLYKINIPSNSVTHYKKEVTNYKLANNTIHSLFKDSRGNLWVGTGYGLQRFDDRTHRFETIEELGNSLIRDIKEDSNGNIFFATATSGLFSYNPDKREWKNYTHKASDSGSLPHNNVLSIFTDSKKQIWVTTQGGGFARLNKNDGAFTRFSSYNKLPNDVVYQILEDDRGLFWISTNEGLIHFNPETEEFFTYSLEDGLLSKQFNYKSALRASDGMFYMGTLNGFITFNPNDTYRDRETPHVILTDFLLFNKKVVVGALGSPLSKSITFSDKVTLNHDQNYFSLKFANLNYHHPKHSQYLYKLEGFDSEWILTNETNTVYYPNLTHGKYIFRLKSANSDQPDLISLPIEIRPPFWQSSYAYFVYSSLIILFAYFAYRYLSKQRDLKNKRRLAIFEQEKEREIYTAKIDFFTDIAHEIRTPLTLIKSPLDHIINNKNLSEDVRENLEIIGKNTNRLQDLTNQLLDFRKIEKQHFHLTFEKKDIVELLDSVLVRFNQLIKLNDLRLEHEVASDEFYVYVDQESIIKIISNLLTNAIKNAATYIKIQLDTESIKGTNYFDIVIENDGAVIPLQEREKIFKPFIQYSTDTSAIKAGTGLGLALARSLAELHQGYLSMDEKEDANSFRLTIPILQQWTKGKDENEEEVVEEVFLTDSPENENYDARQTVLVVEDDKELLAYISKLLSPYYTILMATDGKKALRILENQIVNLILTDIMMSNMSGYDLCREIKTNITSCHIPLIFLTAKDTLASKIQGLELGADAYIEKPFSNEFLLATISNLLNNREIMIEAFKKSTLVQADGTMLSKSDQSFMDTVYKVIEDNLDNPEFNQDNFAMALNMSKSSLYRKMKGLFDISPNDFIRLNRIKRAAKLFEEGDSRVTEVCYLVGFSSPSYFSKCFQKQFGTTPKDFIESQKSK